VGQRVRAVERHNGLGIVGPRSLERVMGQCDDRQLHIAIFQSRRRFWYSPVLAVVASSPTADAKVSEGANTPAAGFPVGPTQRDAALAATCVSRFAVTQL
jgi:hypothetical protein